MPKECFVGGSRNLLKKKKRNMGEKLDEQPKKAIKMANCKNCGRSFAAER